MEEFETEKSEFLGCIQEREFSKSELERIDKEIEKLEYDCTKLHTIESNLTSRKEKIEKKTVELKSAKKRAIIYVIVSAIIALISAILITGAFGPITLYNLIVPLILSEIVLLPIGITAGYPKYSEIKSYLEQNSLQFVEAELERISKESEKSDYALANIKIDRQYAKNRIKNLDRKIQDIFNNIFKEFDITNITVKDMNDQEEKGKGVVKK